MIRAVDDLLTYIRHIHAAIRDEVVATSERSAISALSEIVAEQAGDTIFAIDRVSEEILLEHFRTLSNQWSFILVAEGVGEEGTMVFPPDCPPEQAELIIIIDPIDGTRGLMYQKRPAWILTGVAPNHGAQTTIADIELAVQTEIPLVKQHLSDSLWAIAGQGAAGERYNRMTRESQPLTFQPSQAHTIAQGYGNLARFFPGPRAELAAIDDELITQVLGPSQSGKVRTFEDQYICSGGQFYELIMGHDRWMADLRPLVEPLLQARGEALGLCCHPYDLATELIAREVGIIVTDEHGARLAAPLDVSTNMSWIGYANQAIHDQVAPVLRTVLEHHQLLKP
ncbi:MAG TPA: inositol monophosphatase [Dictyobacter sp.]|jgi:fructose-1,6-bisphosphatase/inositol monophosphatase family enzyme|nr:inositol monophosphatase [Dictyobacter sp.]